MTTGTLYADKEENPGEGFGRVVVLEGSGSTPSYLSLPTLKPRGLSTRSRRSLVRSTPLSVVVGAQGPKGLGANRGREKGLDDP